MERDRALGGRASQEAQEIMVELRGVEPLSEKAAQKPLRV